MVRRKQFQDLVSTNAYLTYSRYWRLVALASTDFCFTIPIAVRTIAEGIASGPAPWVSWADTHSGYSRVFQVPRVLLNQSPALVASFEITRWAAVICAFVFFGFFGFADEAMKNYRLFATTVTKRFGYTTFTETKSMTDSLYKSGAGSQASISLPVFITQQTDSKRDSASDKAPASIFDGEHDLGVHSYVHPDLSGSV
jgi:pheromone a factor receptor